MVRYQVVEWWPKFLGVGLFAVALWAQPAALVGAFYDDGIYAVLAKALAEGEGYRNIHLPGAPAGVHYPVLYPFALSVLWRIWPDFPANVALFQLFDSAVFGIAAWVVAGHMRKIEAPAVVQYVFVPAGFLAFPLLTTVGVRFSEPLFLALAAGAVSYADREEANVRDAVLAGVLAGLATLTRSIGLAVIAGVVMGTWMRQGARQALATLAVAIMLVAPWFGWVALRGHEVDHRIAANYGSYVTEASQAGIGGFLSGLDMRSLGPPARLVIPSVAPWLWYLLAILLFTALVWGAAIAARRAPAVVAALTGYVLFVTLWPYMPDRFMWIVMPWMGALVGWGIVGAWRWNTVARVPAVAVVLAILVGYGFRQVTSFRGRGFAVAAENASTPIRVLAPAIAAGTAPASIVATEAEAGVYLYSGRRTVPSTLFRWTGRSTTNLPPDSALQYFCEAGVTHLALSSPKSDAAQVVAFLQKNHPARLQPLFEITEGPALYGFTCPS